MSNTGALLSKKRVWFLGLTGPGMFILVLCIPLSIAYGWLGFISCLGCVFLIRYIAQRGYGVLGFFKMHLIRWAGGYQNRSVTFFNID